RNREDAITNCSPNHTFRMEDQNMVTLETPRYTRREMAKRLGKHPQTLWNRSQPDRAPEGVILKPMRIGGRLYYTDELIADWQRLVDQRVEGLHSGAKGAGRRRFEQTLDPVVVLPRPGRDFIPAKEAKSLPDSPPAPPKNTAMKAKILAHVRGRQ